MEKGQLGLRLSFYAVVAFILAIFRMELCLFLVAGTAIVVEKNIWLSRQVIQAVCLYFVNQMFVYTFGLLDFMYKIPFVGAAWGIVYTVVMTIIKIVILVFAIIAIVKTANGKEAKVPLANKFANWACGVVMMKK